MSRKLVSAKIRSFLILCMIVALTMYMLLLIPNSRANVYPEITFSPQSVGAKPGTTFNLSVVISDVYELYLYQVCFNFSAEVLEVIGVTKGDFLGRGVYTTYWQTKLNNTNGEVKVWECMLPPDPPMDGTGELFEVTFLVKKSGSCKLSFFDTQLFDQFQGSITLTVENGQFISEPVVLVHSVIWASVTYKVVTTSNSSVTDLAFDQPSKSLIFWIEGETDTRGYVNVTIPKSLLNLNPLEPPYEWSVLIGSAPLTIPTPVVNATHTFVYLEYPHTEHRITIVGNEAIPEFPSLLFLPIFMLAILLASLVHGKKLLEQEKKK